MACSITKNLRSYEHDQIYMEKYGSLVHAFMLRSIALKVVANALLISSTPSTKGISLMIII